MPTRTSATEEIHTHGAQSAPCCSPGHGHGGSCHGSSGGRGNAASWRLTGIVVALTLLGLMLAASLGLADEAAPQEPTIPVLSPGEVPALLTSRENAVLVDVRSRAEYLLLGHPDQAWNLPWRRWNDSTGGLDPNPDFVETIKGKFSADTPIYLICRSGHRSGQATAALLAAGFRNVWSVSGGMSGNGGDQPGWIAEGLPTTTQRHPKRWLDRSSEPGR